MAKVDEDTLPMEAKKYQYKIEQLSGGSYQITLFQNSRAIYSELTLQEAGGELPVGKWQRDITTANTPPDRISSIELQLHASQQAELTVIERKLIGKREHTDNAEGDLRDYRYETSTIHQSGYWKRNDTDTGRLAMVEALNKR